MNTIRCMENQVTIEDIRDAIRVFNFTVNWFYTAMYDEDADTIYIYQIVYDDYYPDDMDFTPVIPTKKLIKSLLLDNSMTKETLKNFFNNVA